MCPLGATGECAPPQRSEAAAGKQPGREGGPWSEGRAHSVEAAEPLQLKQEAGRLPGGSLNR